MLHNFESLSIILFFKLMQPILSLVLNKQSFKVPYICLNTFERISSSFKVRRPVYIVLLTSRKSIETQMRFALSRIQTSVLHEPKINIFSARMHACTIENLLFVAGRRCINPARSQPSQRWIVGERCQERIREKTRSGEERKRTVRHATSATKLA